MAAKGLDMKFISEIRRLKQLKFTKRRAARALGVHRNTITRYWDEESIPAAKAVSVDSSETLSEAAWTANIDWQGVRDEVLKGVSLSVLFEEQQPKIPVNYASFWKQLQKRAPTLKGTMVRVFKPGTRTEIDYCDGISLLNIATGEMIKTELFVGVLCSSRYTFAEFSLTQRSEDFLTSHVRMFEFFGGVTELVSPDNLKSAVTKAHRYDPVINPAYTRLAIHYGFAVVPARVRTPQDKAIVERTIQIFQRWYFFKVRNQIFTSLIELNKSLRENLILFNQKKHRIFKKTRSEMFEMEREHLIKLTTTPYSVATYSRAFLSRDCHLRFQDNYYSAPNAFRGLELEIWATQNSVEIYHKLERVALHARSKTHGKFITDTSHYPPEHQAYLEEDVTRLKERALKIGPSLSTLITELFSGPYPLQYLRRCQGILNLSRKYSSEKLESAAVIANRFNQKTIHYLERVIKLGGEKRKEEKPIVRSHNPYLRGVDKIYH